MSFIRQPFELVLTFFANMTGSYAISILIVTLLIKIILYPLTANSMKMTEKMKVIQPLQQEIQEKYKDDPEQMNARMMDLYRENNVTKGMLSSCLGMLIPLPFLVIMYQVFLNADFAATLMASGISTNFFWIKDLTVADPIILPILSAATMFISMSQTANKDQKAMTIVMPLLFGWITRTLPSGAALYWVFSNIIGILQNILIKYQIRAKERRSANQ